MFAGVTECRTKDKCSTRCRRREEVDEEAKRLLDSWPQTAEFGNATRMGLLFDESCEQIYREYVDSLKRN